MLQIAKSYLYVVSRSDIPIAHQAVQAAHAGIEYALTFGRPPDYHPSYIHLTVDDKSRLEVLRQKLNDANIPTTEFHEPYQNWGLTAIACLVTDSHRYLFKCLSLWRISKDQI